MKYKIIKRIELVDTLSEAEAEWLSKDPIDLQYYIVNGYQGLASYTDEELLEFLEEHQEVKERALELGFIKI